jgi:transglutaminase-like putative cysteine protease
LPHLLRLPVWITAMLGGAIAWRLAAAFYGWRVASRWLRLGLALTALVGVLTEFGTINGVEAGSALLVVMMALKFVESKNQRDQLVLIMISYFLLFAILLREQSPLAVAYLLVMVWLATVGLLQIGRHGPLPAGGVTAKVAGRLLLHSVPIMVLLFLLFPRLPGPLWGMQGNTSSGTSGLGDSMSPGDITNLGLSDEVAFRAEFSSRVPDPRTLYWRGPVLSVFDGRTWTAMPSIRLAPNALATIEHRGEAYDYRVLLEPNGRGWAFALDMPASWSGPRGLTMNADYQLGLFFGGPRAARVTRLDYRATSYADYAAREPLNDAWQDTFRRLPAQSSPRTRALVAQWLADDPTPQEIIDRGMNYLRSQPFFYTLTPPALGAQPVDEFLFDTREGFCEHYASAFAVMMRAAGLPARVVLGYQGGELNRFSRLSSYYIVRQADAHAWTEVWLADRGWVRVDPVSAVAPGRVSLGDWRTSGGPGLEPGVFADVLGGASWLRRVSLAWDAAGYFWDAWVIGYGPEVQRALLGALGLDSPRTTRTERTSILLLLAVAVTVGASIVLSLSLARRARRAPPDAAARYFAAFRRRLSRHDVPPGAASEGPATYAARAVERLPHAAADIRAILEAYLRARYEPDADGAALAELRQRVTRFHLARALRA